MAMTRAVDHLVLTCDRESLFVSQIKAALRQVVLWGRGGKTLRRPETRLCRHIRSIGEGN
uniref:Uncharacterized protein n=1 Tax=Oscillatoriales cyanobacterium SpSt-418 TaxID=2282169 RepID=A0A7C3KI54_9CYAN